MIRISHRGNTFGPDKKNENHPDYILSALDNYYCEVDVWMHNDQLYFGHDEPQYPADWLVIDRSGIIAHAKNIGALDMLLRRNIHCFSHDKDDYVLTNKGWIWAYPDKPSAYLHQTIAVLPELHNTDVAGFAGVCSDYVDRY